MRHALDLRAEDFEQCRLARLDTGGDTSERYVWTVRDRKAGHDRHIFVKRYREDSPVRHDVGNEWRGLRLTHDAFATTALFRVPVPYAASPEHRLLFMEYCPAPTLGEVLFRDLKWSRLSGGPRGRGRLLSFATRLGSLLARLQETPCAATVIDGAPTPERALARYRATMCRNLTACEAVGFPRALLNRVHDYFRDRLVLPPDTGPLVPQHSDFGPWNVLVGSSHVYLVDFHNFTEGLPAYDAAYCSIALGLWTRYRTVSRVLVRQVQSTFLRSVARCAADSPLFRALCVMHLAYFASTVVSQRPPMHEALYLPVPWRRFMVECLQRHLAC